MHFLCLKVNSFFIIFLRVDKILLYFDVLLREELKFCMLKNASEKLLKLVNFAIKSSFAPQF